MKKFSLMITLLLLSVLGTSNAWAYHGGHARFGVYVGGPYWGPSYYSPYYSPYSYYPPYYPLVVVTPPAPPVYIQQQPVITTPAPAPAPVAPAAVTPENYWYYCAATKSYYPYVKDCRNGWTKVSPQPPGQP